jgi:glycosyltransferase involved in cell wall biosynthesis
MRNLPLLIPCYNDQAGLTDTLLSLDEDLSIYVYVIDDGSQPPISIDVNRLPPFIADIHLLRSDKNQGLIKTLNSGIDAIQKFHGVNTPIGRLDCGDLPNRHCFTRRFNEFQKENMSIYGCAVRFIDKEQPSRKFKFTQKLLPAGRVFPLRTNYIHSGILYRPKALRYDPLDVHCEDVILFYKLDEVGLSGFNNEISVEIFQNDGGISTLRRTEQLRSLRSRLLKVTLQRRPVRTLLRVLLLTIYLVLKIDKKNEIKIKAKLIK